MSKDFLTYKEQIIKLRDKKQLLIPNPEFAEKTLEQLSYFSLINGYKDLFKHKPSGNYLRGVTFEEITAFYYFDEQLRTLFLKYILHIERELKSIFSYTFCEKNGKSQHAYLNPYNYNYSNSNNFTKNAINKLTDSLSKTIDLPSKYPYINHYAKVHHNIPLWVATNAITFGKISKMYQYSTTDIRAKISLKFNHVNETELHKFIRILAACRNVCAHGERLYDFNINEAIPNMPLHKYLHIPIKKEHYVMGKNDLFAVVIALNYLLDDSQFKTFLTRLEQILNSILDSCPHLPQNQLYQEMGFPTNWTEIIFFEK